MELYGHIVELKARESASGDVVQKLVLEVHGSFGELSTLIKRPLRITLVDEKAK